MRVSLLILIAVLTLEARAQDSGSLRVESLRVNHVEKPFGLDTQSLFLSWRLASDQRGQHQSAYQIVVWTDRGTVWDTGRVESDQSIHIPYAGPRLAARTRYHWRVRAWDRDGRAGSYSAASWWETGLQGAWASDWISANQDTLPGPAPLFRKAFEISGDVERARLYIAGLGYHEASLNGRRIGDHVLDPAATGYDRSVLYLVHDVTQHLAEGANVIGVHLGNGWYNQHTRSAWDFDRAPWRAAPTVKAQLEITYRDGSMQRVATDTSWSTATGPIIFDGIRNGEHYDARRERPGWDAPGYDDRGWARALRVDGPTGELTPQIMPPIRVTQTRFPVRVDQTTDSTVVYDFGQNLTGWAHIQVRGSAGAEVAIRYGERLFDDGTLDQRELSRFIREGETQTDRYTLRGGASEEWHPRFVYHGFQYAEVVVPEGVDIELMRAEVVHTDFQKVGSFTSSNALLNQIHQNLQWSFLGNFHGYPTDCPHREKIGWSGDAHLAAPAGLYLFDAAAAYHKWIDDFADEQRPSGQVPGIIPTSGWGYTFGREERYRPRGYGPAWEGAYVLIPWYVYLFTGDASILSRHYDGLRAYVDYLADHAEGHIVRFGIDDHKPATTRTEPPLIQTGHYYEATRVVAEMGRILGRDVADLERRLQAIRIAFRETFYDGATWGNGGQTSIAGAIYHGLADSGAIDLLLADIEARDGHIDAGVVGTRYVLKVLAEADENETAYRMVTRTTYPGWGYWIAQGATTLWQDWDGSMSLNHVMFGSVGEWLMGALAGIQPDQEYPGFKRTIIKPAVVGDLEFVRASHRSPYGVIESAWNRAGRRLTMEVTVPLNTTALVYVPAGDTSRVTSSHPDYIRFVGMEGARAVYEVASGSYTFESTLP